jgi:hypothetical protein
VSDYELYLDTIPLSVNQKLILCNHAIMNNKCNVSNVCYDYEHQDVRGYCSNWEHNDFKRFFILRGKYDKGKV